MKTKNLFKLAAEQGWIESQEEERTIKNTMKAHQIRSEYYFTISNTLKKELDGEIVYTFDYDIPEASYVGGPPNAFNSLINHVLLIDTANQNLPKLKVARFLLPEELFRSANLRKISQKEHPYWLQDHNKLSVFTVHKQKSTLEFLEQKAQLKPIITNPKFVEIFFNGRYVGVFFTGYLNPSLQYLDALEETAQLILNSFS